jgi:hypothetical protein
MLVGTGSDLDMPASCGPDPITGKLSEVLHGADDPG